jgi:hypothetical protein
MLGIASYAISIRIHEYGITFPRIWIIALLVIAAVTVIRYLMVWILADRTIMTTSAIAARIQRSQVWPVAGVILAIIGFIVINAESLSVRQHLQRVSQSASIEQHIDRRFIKTNGPKHAIPLLTARYATADTIERLDILYTLDYLKKDRAALNDDYDVEYTPNPYRDQVNAALFQLESIETASNIKTIIQQLKQSDVPHAYSCSTSKYANSTDCSERCIEPVTAVLKETGLTTTRDDVADFCRYPY